MWWILACTAPNSPDAGVDGTRPGPGGTQDDTAVDSTPPTDSSGSFTSADFTLGAVEPCSDPIPPRWTEAGPGTEYDRPASDTLQGIEPGAIALVGAALYWVRDGGRVLRMDLPDGEPTEMTWTTEAVGFSLGDLDGDGVEDLVVSGFAPAIVWSVGTADEAVLPLTPGQGARWARDIVVADFDGRSGPDLFFAYTGQPDDSIWLQSEVLFNEGGRVFGDPVPVDAGSTFWGRPFDATAIDEDGDGDPDVFLCNDMGNIAPNGLLLNDGAGKFVPAGAGSGLDLRMNCMGATWGDLDGGGVLDAVLSDTLRAALLQRYGDVFVDVTAARGLPPFDARQMAWGASVVDADNDGRADLVVGTGEFWVARAEPFPLLLLTQGADGLFADSAALPRATATRGVVTADLNADGVVDVVAGDAFRSPWVLLSDGCTDEAWIEVQAPPGSRVVVTSGDSSWAALASHESGFGSAGPSRVHVGLGGRDVVDRILVDVPGGGRYELAGPITPRRRLVFAPDQD